MKLPDGYEFSTVETDEDVEELLKFHSIVHPDDDPNELRRQIYQLPGFGIEKNFYIRDMSKKEIVCALNTFRNCYLFNFMNGKIENITDLGMQEVDANRRFRSPPDDLVRLVFGTYSIDELSHNNIDFIVSNGLKSLIQTLFPKRESCIYNYMV